MSVIQRDKESITFAVDDVVPAHVPLETCKTHEAVRRLLDAPIESCCDYSDDCVMQVWWNPLIHAVYHAFSQHRPLTLSPDMIWITITQGVAIHINQKAEALRSRFVAHEGKARIEIERDDFVKGSPENPWPEVFAEFSKGVAQHVGEDVHRFFVADFSTTGPVERTVSEIVMLDAFQQYFEYVMTGICGIPRITLEGTVDDWRHIRRRIEDLDRYDLGWWRLWLRPICDEFVRAAEGRPNIDHWRRICKLREDYGPSDINGWIVYLFPYLEKKNDPVKYINVNMRSLVRKPFALPPDCFPKGLSEAPFVFKDVRKGKTYPMRMIGGFVGVTQDEETLALRPKLGWAVRDAPRIDCLMEKLKHHDSVTTFPANASDDAPPDDSSAPEYSAEIAQLSECFRSIEFFPNDEQPLYRFNWLRSSEDRWIGGEDWQDEKQYGRSFTVAFRGSDGSWIGYTNTGDHWLYFLVVGDHSRKPFKAALLGFSIADVIEQILAANGQLLQEQPDFQAISMFDPTEYDEVWQVAKEFGPED